MLIKFKVRNFRSFADEQTFFFSTSSDSTLAETHCLDTGIKSVPRVSKAAVIFGPNGSGKSNLIRAFALMRDLVLNSTSLTDGDFAERYAPFVFDCEGGSSTGFEIDLVLQGIRYKYGFAFDQERIVAEKLLIYSTGKSQRWFERGWDPVARREFWLPFSQNFSGPRSVWRDATCYNSLFLSTAAQLNSKQLEPLFRWFDRGLKILTPFESGKLSGVAASLREDTFRAQMVRFLKGADIRIDDLRVPEPEMGPARAPAAAPAAVLFDGRPLRTPSDNARVQFAHFRDGRAVWLDAADESAGIQRLTWLFGPFLEAVEQGSLLLIDEFDLSLHSLVARYLIELMTARHSPTRSAQLLLTSHNTTLMDVSVLRRDQIWLMAMNDLGASELSPVWRHASPPRRNELIGNGYIRGRFGAVPLIRPLSVQTAHPQKAAPLQKRRKHYMPS